MVTNLREQLGLGLAGVVYVVLTWFTAWAIANCVRTGVWAKWSTVIHRRQQPILFWVALAPTILAFCLEIGLGVFVAHEVLKNVRW